MPVAIVIIVVIAVVLIAVLVRLAGGERPSAIGSSGNGGRSPRLHLNPLDFTVEGDVAVVTFDVALHEGDEDRALADLLAGQAIEVVRDKQSRGLPLQGISSVRAMGRRGDAFVEAVSVGLVQPGELPPQHDAAELEAVIGGPPVDPLGSFLDVVPVDEPLGLPVRADKTLPPLSEEIRLTSGVVAALRLRNADATSMRPEDLVLALLDLSGYAVRPLEKAGTFLATQGGAGTFISVVDHVPGSYPELSEQAVNGFLAAFFSSGAERGLLFSDKFCPHIVYEKERREPRVRFVTRERVQAFVNSMAVR